jgi:hypothetical protein
MTARVHRRSYKCPGTITNGMQIPCDSRDTYPEHPQDTNALYFQALLNIY